MSVEELTCLYCVIQLSRSCIFVLFRNITVQLCFNSHHCTESTENNLEVSSDKLFSGIVEIICLY